MSHKYPKHLWTIEWTMPDPLPAFFHHYTTEDEARLIFQSAISNMNRADGAILLLRLYHRHAIQATASFGSHQSPATKRTYPPAPPRPSNLYFNSVEVMAAKRQPLPKVFRDDEMPF